MTKKGRELEFISRINRDGSGTTPVDDSFTDFVQDTDFEMIRLSMTEDTWIATHANAYVVRLKKTTIGTKHVLPAVFLDVEMIVGDNTALLIQYPTRIEYEVQAGGLGCTHPTCEGFCINIGSLGQDFDDCSYGCAWIGQDEEIQNKLAKDLEKYLEEKTKDWRYQILFDYDRLKELQEGWWPVVVIGKINGGIIATEKVNWKGYVHTGNCD